MSLAFSAAVLFLVFVPGVILRRSYLSEPFSKAYFKSSFSDEVGFAVIPALILQVMMIFVTEASTQYRIDFRTLGVLLVGAHDESAQAAAFESLQRNFRVIAAYNIFLWAAAAVLGHLARRLVIAREWDIRYPLLRFNNEWYYFLTGREWGLKSGADFDVVWLDALVSTGSATVIYSGILRNFQMSADGSLDSICLSEAEKKVDDLLATTFAIPVKGLILQYEKILNLNVSFYFAAERGAGKESEQEIVQDDGD